MGSEAPGPRKPFIIQILTTCLYECQQTLGRSRLRPGPIPVTPGAPNIFSPDALMRYSNRDLIDRLAGVRNRMRKG